MNGLGLLLLVVLAVAVRGGRIGCRRLLGGQLGAAGSAAATAMPRSSELRLTAPATDAPAAMSRKFKITPRVDRLTMGVDEANIAASRVISGAGVEVHRRPGCHEQPLLAPADDADHGSRLWTAKMANSSGLPKKFWGSSPCVDGSNADQRPSHRHCRSEAGKRGGLLEERPRRASRFRDTDARVKYCGFAVPPCKECCDNTGSRDSASAAAAMLGATVIVTAAPAHADEQFWGAIAYSPLDGTFGKSSQQPKESDARKAAISTCAITADLSAKS